MKKYNTLERRERKLDFIFYIYKYSYEIVDYSKYRKSISLFYSLYECTKYLYIFYFAQCSVYQLQ